MKHFGLMINHEIFYSFHDNCYYFGVFDNRSDKRCDVWRKCPFDDIYMQERMVFTYLLDPCYQWMGCGIYEVYFDIENNKSEIINEWEHDEITEYRGHARTEFVESVFKEKLNMLKAKYPSTTVIPAA